MKNVYLETTVNHRASNNLVKHEQILFFLFFFFFIKPLNKMNTSIWYYWTCHMNVLHTFYAMIFSLHKWPHTLHRTPHHLAKNLSSILIMLCVFYTHFGAAEYRDKKKGKEKRSSSSMFHQQTQLMAMWTIQKKNVSDVKNIERTVQEHTTAITLSLFRISSWANAFCCHSNYIALNEKRTHEMK